jgi:hypothetical protein
MTLYRTRVIEIPASEGSKFDHAAFDPKTRRIFAAHTARHRLEVIDHDTARHVAALEDFPGAAGVVADDGAVLVTNRGAANLAWVDAQTLQPGRYSMWVLDRTALRLSPAHAWRWLLASGTRHTIPSCKFWSWKVIGDGRIVSREDPDGA